MIKNNTGERLYKDLSPLERRFAIINNDLLPAVCYCYDLSALEMLIFMYISTEYESRKLKQNKRSPVKISYADLVKKLKRSKNGIVTAIKHLTNEELITPTNERKGRAKTEYVPNVEKIHQLIDKYINLGL